MSAAAGRASLAGRVWTRLVDSDGETVRYGDLVAAAYPSPMRPPAGAERVVQVTVSHLRKRGALVECVRGVGYRLARRGAAPMEPGERRLGRSGYRGVRISAGINLAPGERTRLGTFSTVEEAARAYDEAARRHFGPGARLNFPDRDAR